MLAERNICALLHKVSDPEVGVNIVVRFIGVGRYVRIDLPARARIAVAVLDEYQGMGVGPLLIRHLVRIAHENSITQFEADVMGGNQRMLTLLRNSGCIIHHVNSAGVVHFTLQCPESPGLSAESSELNYTDRQSEGPEGGSHG